MSSYPVRRFRAIREPCGQPLAIIQSVPEAAFRAATPLRVASVRAGRNAVQVQRWLGHHSPAFTLRMYVHLLNDDLGGPLSMPRKPGDLALAEASAAPVAA